MSLYLVDTDVSKYWYTDKFWAFFGFHVEMMGFLGMGNNPMVGATVAVAVAVEEAQK